MLGLDIFAMHPVPLTGIETKLDIANSSFLSVHPVPLTGIETHLFVRDVLFHVMHPVPLTGIRFQDETQKALPPCVLEGACFVWIQVSGISPVEYVIHEGASLLRPQVYFVIFRMSPFSPSACGGSAW